MGYVILLWFVNSDIITKLLNGKVKVGMCNTYFGKVRHIYYKSFSILLQFYTENKKNKDQLG